MGRSHRGYRAIAVSVFSAGALAQNCDDTIQGPVVIPVKNVTVEGNLLRRGMQLQLGTPSQNLAVAVSQGWNESYIYNQNGYCSGLTAAACTVGRGGPYDTDSSSTYSTTLSISDFKSGDKVTEQAGSNGTVARDTIVINSTLSYEDFEFVIPGVSGPDYSSFGLGKTSRILAAAKNAGTIASNSWSLFWGLTGLTSEHAHDGAVVLGGLDSTQTTGLNYTNTIKNSANCRSGMIVEVSDMVVSLPDGTSGSLLSSSAQGQSVNYCLETEFPMITMLNDHFYEWQSIDPSVTTDGSSVDRAGGGPNVWGLIFPPENMTKADLKITLGGSLEITIPNHQLVQAYYTFAEDGSIAVNNTRHELMINKLQAGNAQDIPKFGMTFFQAAYLHVNYDRNEFSLWQAANPTGANSKFAGIGESTTGCAASSNATSNNNGTANVNSSSDGSSGGMIADKSGISGGAIGGIVAGTVVGTLALVALAFFLWRRRRNSGRKGPPSETVAPLNDVHNQLEKPELMGSYSDNMLRSSGYYTGKSELDSSTHSPWMAPQEAPANAVHRPTMEPQEMPAERY